MASRIVGFTSNVKVEVSTQGPKSKSNSQKEDTLGPYTNLLRMLHGLPNTVCSLPVASYLTRSMMFRKKC
ncbi:unnamed protein product [Calypogeia fissa]